VEDNDRIAPRIAAAASAFPRHSYSREQIASALERHWAGKLPNTKALGRLLTRVGVEGRHLARSIDEYDVLTTWGKSNHAWIDAAEELAEQSICRALTRAGLSEQDLDAVFFVFVTGIASPSIDARMMNRMNLRANIKRIPIIGLGCVAGAAGIARPTDYVRAYPDQAHRSTKACGEGIMLDGLAALRDLGVMLGPGSTSGFSGIRFADDDSRVEAPVPHGVGYGIRRTAPHRLMVERAEQLRISLHRGSAVTGLSGDRVSVGGQNIRYRWLACADGRNSRLRRQAGLDASRCSTRRFGFRRHYKVAP
jgi:hypothetical protein